MGNKIRKGKGIVLGLFVIMMFIIFLNLILAEAPGSLVMDTQSQTLVQKSPTTDADPSRYQPVPEDMAKANNLPINSEVKEGDVLKIGDVEISGDLSNLDIKQNGNNVEITDKTNGNTMKADAGKYNADAKTFTNSGGKEVNMNGYNGADLEVNGNDYKLSASDKSVIEVNSNAADLEAPSSAINNNLGSACGCGITGGVISTDSMTGNAIAPITGFAGGCSGACPSSPSDGEGESAAGGGGGSGITPGADTAIQAFLGVWSSLSGILSSIGQAVKDGAAKSGGSSSLTSTGSDLTASYTNGGGVGLNDNKASAGTTGTAGTSTATMGSGSSSTTTTGKAVSDSNTVSYQSRDGRTAIMEQEDLTKPGKTIIKSYNNLGLREMESENTKMHLFTKEGSEVKRLVTLHMPEQKTSIINDPNGGTPKLSNKARENDMSGTGSGVTGNAVSGDAIADISSEGQYVNIEGYDMKIGGEKMDIKIYKPFNDIIAKGSLLVVRDADSRFEFNGNRMYYNRIPPQNLHFINRIANGLDNSNEFSLFPGGENGNYLVDGKKIATVGDEVVEHPNLKGIYIAKEREEMFKKATGMK